VREVALMQNTELRQLEGAELSSAPVHNDELDLCTAAGVVGILLLLCVFLKVLERETVAREAESCTLSESESSAFKFPQYESSGRGELEWKPFGTEALFGAIGTLFGAVLREFRAIFMSA